MHITEIPLLWRLRRGDQQAFDTVVREHYASVYRQHYLLTQDRDRAADLTQETFVEAWKSLPRFLGRSRIRTWLYTIAVRVWRRKGQESPAHRDLAEAEAQPSATLSPEDAAVQAMKTEQITCALRRLPEDLRVVLVLHYRQEMTHSEVAAALQIPQGTVKSRLSEGLKRMRKILLVEENDD